MDATDRLTTALSDRYAIEAEIDSGGMATVYRARDLKHDRTVAIKVLRPDLAEAIGADRFLREIRTTANLSHPHVLPLFDSGEADGFLFYVMPFVKGESLRDRLEREDQLPIEDAVQIAREVAEALAYAHKNGVIHRDIKPANILLDEGHALLADFGIAQARAGAEETKLTGSGMSLGTPSYMSPEQIAGDREVDGRADQYALGCVLFEMLAGTVPFTGGDIQTVMRQHLAADAPSVTQARPSVPKGVAKALERALAKTPADRFRSMGEFETALAGATLPLLARIPMGRARTAVFAVSVVLALAVVAVLVFPSLGDEGPELVPNRVVVLPFENRIDDPSLADLGDLAASMVGEAIQQMELVIPVSVDVSRQYAEAAATEGSAGVTLMVGERTGAALAVVGTIFGIGDSIRYQLDVIDVAAEESLQKVVVTGSLDRPLETIGLLGERVAGALALRVDPYFSFEVERLPASPALEAYRSFKAGFEAADRRDWAEALEFQRAAYDLDTTFAWPLPYAGTAALNLGNRPLADSLYRLADLRRDFLSRSGQLSLDHGVAIMNNDRQAALRATREMAELNPLGFAPIPYAFEALRAARPLEAIEALRGYDPPREWISEGQVTSLYLVLRCQAYHMLGEHEQELVEARRARELVPNNLGMLILEIQARAALHQVEEVMDLLEQAPALSPNPLQAAEVAGMELWAHGHPDEAQAAFERGIQWSQDRLQGEEDRFMSAWLRYNAGRWEESHALFRALNTEQPENLFVLGLVGRSAAHMGDTATAREISRQIAGTPWPEHEYHHLMNLAFLAAVLGEPDEAMRLFRESIARGDPNRSLSYHRQLDLESLYQREDWQELMGPKG